MKLFALYLILLLPLSALAQKVIAESKVESLADSPFESLLINKLWLFNNKIKAGEVKKAEWDSVRRELTILRQSLANYYVLTGTFPSALMPQKALADTSRLIANSIQSPPTATPNNPAGLVRAGPNWVFPSKGNNQPKNDTYQSYTLSPDNSLIALSTASQLTIKRVSDGSVVGQPLTKIANPVYSFSKKDTLYIADQLNPSWLKSIGEQGTATLNSQQISRDDSLARLHYRIDQIQADDKLVVARRVISDRTVISVLNWEIHQREFGLTLNYPINTCRIAPVQPMSWLLAAHRADRQGYQLLLARPDKQGNQLSLAQAGQPVRPGFYAELMPQIVSEYRLDERGNLVVLRADNSLVMVNLQTDPPSSTTIADNARYFDWRGDTLVYWQQRDPKFPDKWGLHVYKLGTKPDPLGKAGSGFWYDTDLRRDVPRFSLKGNEVYFEDHSNNTANWVTINPRLVNPIQR